MKPYTLAQIRKEAVTNGYKLGMLCDQAGRDVIPGNGASVKVTTWLDEKVKPYLSRPNLTPGVYTIKMYNDFKKKTPPELFPIAVGDVTDANGNVTVIMQQPLLNDPGQNVLSYKEVMSLKEKLIKLELENEQLKKEMQEWEEMEEEEETPAPNPPLADNPQQPQHWLADLMPGVISGLEQFFKDREEQRKLQWAQMIAMNPQMAQFMNFGQQQPAQFQAMQNPTYKPAPQPDPTMVKADQFFAQLQQQNPEAFERVQKILQGMATPNDFFVELNKQEPEIYQALNHFLNAA